MTAELKRNASMLSALTKMPSNETYHERGLIQMTSGELRSGNSVRILHITSSRREFCELAEMAGAGKWTIAWAPTLESARRALCEDSFSIVVCDSELLDGSWRDVNNYVADLESPPKIILAGRADDLYQWAEALNLGAYDVLVKPLDKAEILHVFRLAWHASRRRIDGSSATRSRMSNQAAAGESA